MQAVGWSESHGDQLMALWHAMIVGASPCVDFMMEFRCFVDLDRGIEKGDAAHAWWLQRIGVLGVEGQSEQC
jgi:hypothetical protein